MMKTLASAIIFLFVLSSFYSRAQNTSMNAATSFEESERLMASYIQLIAENGSSRLSDSLNILLKKELARNMANEGAMDYNFEKLSLLSDLKNESMTFRIFTWELTNSNGEIEYHGVASYRDKHDIYCFVLVDSSASIRPLSAQSSTLRHNRWYGALYYDLREYEYKGKKSIVLLGINRKEELMKKKIIEIAIPGEKLIFGSEVFNIPEENHLRRKIYAYAVEADMSIWFDEEDKDIILLDHLSPLKPMYEGRPEYYVPDLSFDALTLKKGIWNYNADWDAKMEKNLKDRYYEMELPKQKKVY